MNGIDSVDAGSDDCEDAAAADAPMAARDAADDEEADVGEVAADVEMIGKQSMMTEPSHVQPVGHS
jgi:hypothetical protein